MSSAIPVKCANSSAQGNTLSDNVHRNTQGKDISKRAVFACNEVGLGREGLAAICEVLDMPSPVVTNAWVAHDNELYKQHLIAVKEQLGKNQEVKELHDKEDENSVAPISVSFDGTCAKRGFTSNHGVGFIYFHRNRESTWLCCGVQSMQCM